VLIDGAPDCVRAVTGFMLITDMSNDIGKSAAA